MRKSSKSTHVNFVCACANCRNSKRLHLVCGWDNMSRQSSLTSCELELRNSGQALERRRGTETNNPHTHTHAHNSPSASLSVLFPVTHPHICKHSSFPSNPIMSPTYFFPDIVASHTAQIVCPQWCGQNELPLVHLAFHSLVLLSVRSSLSSSI